MKPLTNEQRLPRRRATRPTRTNSGKRHDFDTRADDLAIHHRSDRAIVRALLIGKRPLVGGHYLKEDLGRIVQRVVHCAVLDGVAERVESARRQARSLDADIHPVHPGRGELDRPAGVHDDPVGKSLSVQEAASKEGDASCKGRDEKLRRAGARIATAGFPGQVDDYLVPSHPDGELRVAHVPYLNRRSARSRHRSRPLHHCSSFRGSENGSH